MSAAQNDESAARQAHLAWPLLLALAGVTGLLVGCVATSFRMILMALDEQRGSLFSALAPIPVLGWLAPILLVGTALWLAAELVRRYAPEAATPRSAMRSAEASRAACCCGSS